MLCMQQIYFHILQKEIWEFFGTYLLVHLDRSLAEYLTVDN